MVAVARFTTVVGTVRDVIGSGINQNVVRRAQAPEVFSSGIDFIVSSYLELNYSKILRKFA